MIDIAFIRQHPDIVQRAADRKGFSLNVQRITELDATRRTLLGELESSRAEKNRLSDSIPTLEATVRGEAVESAKKLRSKIEGLENDLSGVDNELKNLLLQVPNIPGQEVPDGTGEADNVLVRTWGEPAKFDFPALDHIELAARHRLVDFERPRQYAGSRSYALIGWGVLLEQAVLRLAMDILMERGLVPVQPPVLVKPNALVGTGFFPYGREDTYHISEDELYLCGTSEVGLVSLHMDSIIPFEALPIRYVGVSPCFRREAGATGRDTKGLYRVHQFTKIEQVSIVANDENVSLQEHMFLLENSERILRALELPHRICLACAPELGFPQVRKHEVESWFPSRGAYGETHSCSTLHDFQARRSNIRYRTRERDLKLVHTLNNTGLASPRILAAFLENHQTKDGSVTIPSSLRPYLGGREAFKAV